jgi:hypothetical protein
MLGLLLAAAAIGGIAGILAGSGAVFWVVAIVAFVLGLPMTLIGGFVDDRISYSSDRADYRQLEADDRADYRRFEAEIAADVREAESVYRADARMERLVGALRKHEDVTYNDNRQVHLHR